jgi:hypothetical protein
MSNTWKLEKVELKLKESLRESMYNLIYFDVIDFSKYGLDINDVKPIIEKYATLMFNNVYKYSNSWISLESDRIKIEKR